MQASVPAEPCLWPFGEPGAWGIEPPVPPNAASRLAGSFLRITRAVWGTAMPNLPPKVSNFWPSPRSLSQAMVSSVLPHLLEAVRGPTAGRASLANGND